MFGCLGRVGCLVAVAVLAVGGWFTKPYWYPRVRSMVVATPPADTIAWTPITPEAAKVGTRAAERLAAKNGPVYASLTPAEFVAWQLTPAMKILGSAAAKPEASVQGEVLLVRASVAVSELGDPKSLGPLGSMLDGRQPVLIGGKLSMLKPGLLGMQVTQMTVNELRLPSALIDRIVRRIAVKQRTDSLAPDVIAISVPEVVADVRITKGKIVLYKAVP
ncbi:MAG: hypothetical protein Q8K55_05890 [Gemmatimonadaceae bacterium]|nr:hypothetical protein [Gemmatimonadaceae bacterium]